MRKIFRRRRLAAVKAVPAGPLDPRHSMCGIAGIFAFDHRPNDFRSAAQRMAQAMRARGPDDEGYLLAGTGPSAATCLAGNDTPADRPALAYIPRQSIDSAAHVPHSLCLAHRRLSIIDLSMHGHQPMCTEDGRFWIVYNGEIYNHAVVREELAGLGEKFLGHSDTEVLLRAWRRWGADALGRLLGMFAFAIWDDHEKTLVLIRDRLGVKPLYYVEVNGGSVLLFASDIRTLIASGLYRAEPDMEGLYYALSFGVAPRPVTAFRDVRALEQGCWMRVDSTGARSLRRYWSVPTGTQDSSMTERQAMDLVEERLSAAVERRLVADVPVGAFMSGGIDSTTVAAMASLRHPGITAFTLAFTSDRKLDEVAQARATAGMYRINHVVRNVADEQALEHLDAMIDCYEEPFYDLSPNLLVSRVVAEHGVKVVLNGLGGDELFAGYPYFRWTGRWRALRRLRLLFGLAKHLPLLGHLALRLDAIGRARTADRFALAARCFLADEEKRALFRNDPMICGIDTVERIHTMYVGPERRFSSDLDAISYIDVVNYLGNHHVYRVDKFTMHCSIEGRMPFLDHELVEAAFRIPDRLKLHAGTGKYVLRRVAEKYLHPSCLAARKKGFDLPTDRWMRGQLAALVRDSLGRLGRRGPFDPRIVRLIYEQWRARARSFRGVWELVALELWLQRFIDRPA